MALLTPRECLEPPDGTGDLSPRALWPQAYAAGGNGRADVEAALAVYLAEGYARASNVDDEDRKNESARQWARHRAFRQAYERMLVSASSVGTDDGYSASILLTQIQDTLAYAEAAKEASDALLGIVEAPVDVFVPPRQSSKSVEVTRVW